MKQRQDDRWPDAHVRLKKLYDERVRQGMSQEDFGEEFDIGSQGMVWQYLNGYTPLNFESAAKFAKGLRCTVRDISPEMDDIFQHRIAPAFGLKKWRRAAALALACLLAPLLSPYPAESAEFSSRAAGSVYYVKRRVRVFLTGFLRFYSALQRMSFARHFQDEPITVIPG